MASKKKAKGKTVARGKKPAPRRRSSKPTKAETVEVRTVAGIGDNSQLALPAPDDYEHHMKSIRGAKDKLETAKSLLSHAKTAANKTCPGLAASISETLQIEREGDPVKLQTRLEMLGMGLKHIGSTIQLSVFDTLAGDEEELVARRGYEDGKAARPCNNKYPVGSSLADLYNENWQKGQAENMAGITQAPSNGEAHTAH